MGTQGLVVRKGPIVLGATALGVLVVAMIHLAGRPLATDDFWWHLKMGEVYATGGLDLSVDPISFTAQKAPDPHQWLFGVALYGARQVVGLQGLRAIHVLLVVGILWLAFSGFRNVSGSALLACGATTAWLAMSWWRLFQFRPDLLSIAAVLGIHRLLLEPRYADAAPSGIRVVPSWTKVLAAMALLVIWANTHTLFAIGLALLVAALLGGALAEVLRVGIGPQADPGSSARMLLDNVSFAKRWAAALGLGTIATLLNPRGIEQHLTFFESAESSALWRVRDEWAHFDPLDPSGYGPAMSPVTFFTADVVMVGFALAAAIALWQLVRRRDPAAVDRFFPVGFGLGLAGIVAMMTAVRFLWMGIFPLLYLLRFARVRNPSDHRMATPVSWVWALAIAGVMVGFFRAPNYQAALGSIPRAMSSYFADAFDHEKYYPSAVEFLQATDLEGRLFNSYAMGGFLAYWFAPNLKTFIDGRMNFPDEVLYDYKTIVLQRAAPNETFLDVLDRRGVDVFLGVGVPRGSRSTEATLYTTASLERSSKWMLVSRSMRHAVYLRVRPEDPAYERNLDRIEAYYRSEDVPFDRRRGFDVSRVIAARPDWAARKNLLPGQYEALLDASRGEEPVARAAAFEALGLAFALSGAYREQLAVDSVAVSLRPRAKAPLRRMVYGLLRLDRAQQAVEVAARLLALDPDDPRSVMFARAANAYLERSRTLQHGPSPGIPPDALINVLPLVAN